MVTQTPWDPRLGVGRELIEYERLFRREGHAVSHYSHEDAFPRPPRFRRFSSMIGPHFGKRAISHVRQRVQDYDVIEAVQGALPASKRELGFDGLLVTRSCGLQQHYQDFIDSMHAHWPETRGRLATRPLRARRRRLEVMHNLMTLQCADLINVLNDAEVRTCEAMGFGGKTVKLPHGLEQERFELFAAARRSAPQAPPVIVTVGAWSARKGAKDLRRILTRVREEVPARFLAIGAGVSTEVLRADVGGPADAIESFEPDELPALLAQATVGVFPSYVEGFPISLLEMLAAGLPVVGYDISGVRAMLGQVDEALIVPVGDAEACGERLAGVLRAPSEHREQLSATAARIARTFKQEEIARATLARYSEALERLRDDG